MSERDELRRRYEAGELTAEQYSYELRELNLRTELGYRKAQRRRRAILLAAAAAGALALFLLL